MTKVVIYTLQRYLQTGAEAALSTVWYLPGPMPKLVIYTARLSTHYATDQSKWAHGCLLGRGRALPVCTTGDLSADTRVWLQFYCLERELLERAPVAKVVCRNWGAKMSSTLGDSLQGKKCPLLPLRGLAVVEML